MSTPSPVIECCISLLRSPFATSEIVIAAGHLIVADAEMNDRVYRAKSATTAAATLRTEQVLLTVLDELESILDDCRKLCAAFHNDPKSHREDLPRLLLAQMERLKNICSE